MKNLFILAVIIIFTNVSFAQNAKDIMDSSKNAYINLEMYQDSGKVLQEVYNLPNQRNSYEKAIYFKTDYASRGLFNFEYYEVGRSNSLYVINRGINYKVQSWWGITNVTKTDISLESPLLAAVGVSSLTSTIIPMLLLPNTTFHSSIFTQLKDEKLIDVEDINGNQCYRIDGNYLTSGTIKIWISKDDFLIRKIEIDKKVKDFRVKSTYQYFPKTPLYIDASVFEFRPNRKVKL